MELPRGGHRAVNIVTRTMTPRMVHHTQNRQIITVITMNYLKTYSSLIKLQYYKLAISYAKQTNNNGYNYELFEDRDK
jgi:hypothetical protein